MKLLVASALLIARSASGGTAEFVRPIPAGFVVATGASASVAATVRSNSVAPAGYAAVFRPSVASFSPTSVRLAPPLDAARASLPAFSAVPARFFPVAAAADAVQPDGFAPGAPRPAEDSGPSVDPETARARLAEFWEGAHARSESDVTLAALEAVVGGRASPAFVAQVRSHMARTIPAPVLRELAAGGYKIHVDERIRQGREDLHEDNDYTGGFHSYGPKGKFIVIAEKIKDQKTGEWRPNGVWENAIDHEIGHAIAYLMGERAGAAAEKAGQKDQAEWYRTKGISEEPEFRDAWRRDFEAIPDEVKAEKTAAGKVNPMHYFLHPDENGWFQRARQETFAESFDILLRGERSRFNYENFRKHFPRSMAALRRIVEREYGAVFAPPH